MNQGSVEQSLDRIAAAIARIERASGRSAGGDDALRARHEQLRSAVSQSLHQLDELLSGREQAGREAV